MKPVHIENWENRAQFLQELRPGSSVFQRFAVMHPASDLPFLRKATMRTTITLALCCLLTVGFVGASTFGAGDDLSCSQFIDSVRGAACGSLAAAAGAGVGSIPTVVGGCIAGQLVGEATRPALAVFPARP
jgi:hypothetical protein